MNKKYILLGIVILLVVVGIGILVLGSSHHNRESNEIVVAANSHTGEPEGGFDPTRGWGCGHVNFEPLIQSTLFKTDKNGSLINDLATNYSVSDDGMKWIVNIRDGVKFSDNTSLSAKDVAFTFNQARHSNSELDMSNLNNATVINDSTVEFNLKEAQSSFIWRLRFVGIIKEDGYDNQTYGQNPIGSGPYKLVQWDKGQQAIFEYNDNYYGKEPFYKKITMVFSKGDASFAGIKSGDLDVAEIEPIFSTQNISDYHLENISASRAGGMSFPMQNDTGLKSEGGNPIGNNVTADLAIRKALNTAIDRQKILDGVFYGHGSVEQTGVDLRNYSNPDAKINDSNPKLAKEILKEVGWEDSNGDGILEKNGLNASFKLYYSSADRSRQAMATEIKNQAKDIGIDIELVGTDWDTIYANQYNSPAMYQQSSIDPFQVEYLQYHSKDPNSEYMNPGLYNNSVVDSYLEQGLSSSLEDSNEYWKKAAFDGNVGYGPAGDASWLWLLSSDYLYLINDNVDIGQHSPTGGADIFENVLEWKSSNSTNSSSSINSTNAIALVNSIKFSSSINSTNAIALVNSIKFSSLVNSTSSIKISSLIN